MRQNLNAVLSRLRSPTDQLPPAEAPDGAPLGSSSLTFPKKHSSVNILKYSEPADLLGMLSPLHLLFLRPPLIFFCYPENTPFRTSSYISASDWKGDECQVVIVTAHLTMHICNISVAADKDCLEEGGRRRRGECWKCYCQIVERVLSGSWRCRYKGEIELRALISLMKRHRSLYLHCHLPPFLSFLVYCIHKYMTNQTHLLLIHSIQVSFGFSCVLVLEGWIETQCKSHVLPLLQMGVGGQKKLF